VGANPDGQCRQHKETRDHSKENSGHSEDIKDNRDWEVHSNEQRRSLNQRFVALLGHQISRKKGMFRL